MINWESVWGSGEDPHPQSHNTMVVKNSATYLTMIFISALILWSTPWERWRVYVLDELLFRSKHADPTKFKGKRKLVLTWLSQHRSVTGRIWVTAWSTLKDVDLIAAEDVLEMQPLSHFEIATPQTSFHEHNAMEKIPDLTFTRIREGCGDKSQMQDSSIILAHDLVKAATERRLCRQPGPSAGITGVLIASGPAPQPHIFIMDFAAKRGNKRPFPRKWPIRDRSLWVSHRVKVNLENITSMGIVLSAGSWINQDPWELYCGSISEQVAFLEENLSKECPLDCRRSWVKGELDLEESTWSKRSITVQEAWRKIKAIKQVAKQYGSKRVSSMLVTINICGKGWKQDGN